MLAYLLRRLLIAVLTIVMISIVAFVIIQLPPGDYVTTYIAQLRASGGYASDAEAAAIRLQYGLDQPIYMQYWRWISQFARGNFGVSMLWNIPVKDVIAGRLGMTVVVTLAAVLLTWMVSLPIGIYSAMRQYSIGDYMFTLVGFIGLAVPSFLLALIVMYIGFAVFDANVGGLFSSAQMFLAAWSMEKVIDLLKHLWLPAVVLGLSGTAQLVRIMRNNLLDEMRKPYVVMGRAKGLSRGRVTLKYAVRVALNPFISTIGYILPELVSGSIIVSIVLGLPTLGPALYQALLAQDMFLAGTIILLIGVMTVIGTLISDLLLIWVDPRIRLTD